jgi:MFS family permease
MAEGSIMEARADQTHPRAYASLAILLLLALLSYIDRITIVLLVDPIKHDLGLTDFQISLVQGLAFALCYALASFPLGWLADRFSRHWVIFGGIVTWSLATTAAAFATSFGGLFAARFLVGVGEATLMPAAYSLLGDLFPPHRRAFATGVLVSGAVMGAALAMIVGGALYGWAQSLAHPALPLLGAVHPWRLVFVCIGLPGLPMALLVFLIPRRQRETGRGLNQAPRASIGAWLRDNAAFVGGLSTVYSLFGAAGIAVNNWTPAFLSRVMHVEIARVGYAVGAVQMIGGFAGFLGTGMLLDRLHARKVSNASYRFLLVTATLALVLAPFAFLGIRTIGAMLAALGLLYLLGAYGGAVIAHLQLVAPRALRAQIIAFVTMIGTAVSNIIGPSMVAGLTDYAWRDPLMVGWSIATTYAICAAGTILALVATWRASLRALAASGEA